MQAASPLHPCVHATCCAAVLVSQDAASLVSRGDAVVRENMAKMRLAERIESRIVIEW